jgi:hypothetical protein
MVPLPCCHLPLLNRFIHTVKHQCTGGADADALRVTTAQLALDHLPRDGVPEDGIQGTYLNAGMAADAELLVDLQATILAAADAPFEACLHAGRPWALLAQRDVVRALKGAEYDLHAGSREAGVPFVDHRAGGHARETSAAHATVCSYSATHVLQSNSPFLYVAAREPAGPSAPQRCQMSSACESLPRIPWPLPVSRLGSGPQADRSHRNPRPCCSARS